MVTVEILLRISEAKNVSQQDKQRADAILNAYNDWPEQLGDISEFMDELRRYLGVSMINKEAIQNKLTSMNPQTDAWRMESLAELLTVLEEKDLETIIEKLQS